MSPGNLQVERYIGSYLISQRVPPNVKSTKRYQNQQQPKQKNTDAEKVPRSYNKYCFPQREHHVGGPPRYPMPPLPVEYGHQFKQNPGGSGWAGVPLISMTSGHHRRNKKVPSTTNPNQLHKYPNKQTQQHCFTKGKDLEEIPQNDSDRSPLTRLAIHTQGAPLIQAGRFGNNNNNRCRNNVSREQATRVYRGDGVRWDSTKDTKTTTGKEAKEQPCGNTDNSSVASDESSANSENSLPRIIKPRKRRKKDRKPITGNTSVTSTAPNDPSQYPLQPERSVETSALKTHLPLCFEHNDANSGEHSTSDLLSDNSHISSYEDKQNEDLIDPLTSADEFPLGNLLDDEDDKESEPATLCQCRYCDPSGVIWDVDQRCYSPFLTPPSPTSPFGSQFRPYRQMPAMKSASLPPSQFSFGGDLASLLRRSWSDPSPYNSLDFQTTECDRERRDCRPASAGLQVSSEIVTSPNGHRDIEIKFYSSSVPLEDPKVKFGASDHDLSDRCFVVEE